MSIADCLESIVDTTSGQGHDLGNGVAGAGIDCIGSTECLGVVEFDLEHIDCNDLICAAQGGTLYSIETDTPTANDRYR